MKFYSLYLYVNRPIDHTALEELMKNLDLTLNTRQYDKLDRPVTIGEIQDSCPHNPKGKAVGTDGLPYMFWSECASDTMPALERLASYITGSRCLPPLQKRL